jgi:ABC-type cobalamin transport system permease subunit
MRKVVAAVLFAVMGACLLLAGVALSHLFDDYKDSPDSMFIKAAAQVSVIALVCLIGGVVALRNGSRNS